MKKITISLICAFIALSGFSQEKKQDSLVLQITMDTTTFKNVMKLIDENTDSRSLTGMMIKQNIMNTLMNYKLVADKPKELIKPTKK